MTVAEYYGRDQDDQDDQEPELRSDGGRELPIGTLVVDRDPADEESGTELVVIDHLDERAADVETVVDANPDVDPDDQVVEAVYVDALDRLVVGWRDMHEQVSGEGSSSGSGITSYSGASPRGGTHFRRRVSSPRTRSRSRR